MGDVGGEQVVHLVGQAGLEHQLRVGGGVADCEVEELRPADPVYDVAEGEGGQQILQSKNIIKPHLAFPACPCLYLLMTICCKY